MKTCLRCQSIYPSHFSLCPRDGTALLEAAEWCEGMLIRGRYRILSKIGQGGMGTVYKAHHEVFDELRALKVMNADLVRDEFFVKRFEQEAVIARKLDHPNAVRVHDIDEAEDGRPFIVMEYIEGVSLKKVIQDEGRLMPGRACSIAVQVAAALDSAHRIGMVHRDIKPANIVLVRSPEGERARVLDFGVAKLKEARAADLLGHTLTGTGTVVGTPQYMSPEQASGKRGAELDGRSDLYSLGVVMYEMLTGELPFTCDTTMGLLMAHINAPPRPMLNVRPELNVPAGLMQLVMRCLEKDPEKRPATGAALIREIPFLEEMEWAMAPTRILRTRPPMQGGGAETASRAHQLEEVSSEPSTSITASRLQSGQAVAGGTAQPDGLEGDVPLAANSPTTWRVIVAAIAAIVMLGAGFAAWRFDSRAGARASLLPRAPLTLAPGSHHDTQSGVSTRQPPPRSSPTDSQSIAAAKSPGGSVSSSRDGENSLTQLPESGKKIEGSPATRRSAVGARGEAAVSSGRYLQASIPEAPAGRRGGGPPLAESQPVNVSSPDVLVLTQPRATISMDGKRIGTADSTGRLNIRGAEPGPHNLQVALAGFPDLDDHLNVPPAGGETSTVVVTAKWKVPRSGPNSAPSPQNSFNSTGKPFPASFGVVHVGRFGLGSSKGVIEIGRDTFQFRAENPKDSFTTLLDGTIWSKDSHGDFQIRLPSGKEYTFRTEAASAIIAAIERALGEEVTVTK
jgi:serine/threonine protein kinase